MILDWYSTTFGVLREMFQSFVQFIPLFLGALLVFVLGWFIAKLVEKLVTEILKRIKFNQIFEKGSWDEALAKADIKVDASAFVGAVVKWILVIVFLTAAAGVFDETPGVNQFTFVLRSVLEYLPNVIAAVLIFVVTVILVDIIDKVVRAAVEQMKIGYGGVVSMVVRWSIWLFAILAILQQLQFRPADWIVELLKILFFGFVAMFAIAFGLGGKDVAAEILQDIKGKMRR